MPVPRKVGRRSASLDKTSRHGAERQRREDEFVATLVHELRNQLGAAMTSLEVIKHANSNADLCARAHATVERQLLHMKRLVDDVLDVSRIAHQRPALKIGAVDLGVILEHAVEACRPGIEAAGQTLTLGLPAGPLVLEADPDRLTQVFCNLLTNASKYTDRGGRIAVALELQGSDVMVRVADNGIGIPRDLLATVFEMFVQVDRLPGRAGGGLGIGLALARQLVELHGGTITARSEGLGRGSEFTVRLPILANHRMAGDPAPRPPQPLPASTCRILLVDDNRDAVESLAHLLSIAGYEAKTAYDGFQALEQAAAYQPEVILLDIGLPQLSGLDVCRAIRKEPWGQAMVVIALTGWGQEADRRRTAEAGFSGHLLKPVHPADLLTHLARVGASLCPSRDTAAAAPSCEP